MKFKNYLCILLFALNSVVDANEDEDFAYKQAKEFAACSGGFMTGEAIAKTIMNQPALAKM
jgi:hypothetical protein